MLACKRLARLSPLPGGWAGAPEGLPQLLTALQQLLGPTQHAAEARAYSVARPQAVAVAEATGGADDEPEPVLRLPDDLRTIGTLNPKLQEVMERHQALHKTASALDTIIAALEAANPGASRPPRANKTALRTLRVDHLRGLLQQLDADSQGNKEALVQRVLRIAEGEQRPDEQAAAAAAARAAAAVKEGVVSQRQVAAEAAVAERLAAAAARGGYGVPESSLRDGHRRMVLQSEFSEVFGPQEVADILVEARGDDVAIIDVRGRCPFTDWMVLATARSQRLARMLAGAVLHELRARAREVAPGVSPTIEGALHDAEWLVVDAGSVVAHVFLEGARQEYALEQLWGAPGGSNIRRVAPKATVHTLDSLR